MDQSTQKLLMDPLYSRINIELVLEQERKWMDTLKIASFTSNGKDPIFATSVVWLIEHGYVPQMEDHHYHKENSY